MRNLRTVDGVKGTRSPVLSFGLGIVWISVSVAGTVSGGDIRISSELLLPRAPPGLPPPRTSSLLSAVVEHDRERSR